MARSYLLENLISIDMLQKVQDNFSVAVGVSLITVDTHGNPVTRPSGFSDFCAAFRATSEKFKALCIRSDELGGLHAVKRRGPSIYRCPCGLVDLAVPIMIRDHHLGSIMAGQVRLSDESAAVIGSHMPYDESWKADRRLREYHERIPAISYSKLIAASKTLFHLANYLVEQGYSNSMAQELSAKNLKIVEESKRTLELEKTLREVELQALSYQVNPHFLFNVLNAIGRLAYFENARKTENVVYGFSDMMRYILNKDIAQFVTVKNEVEHVGNYLYLQQIRMSDKFSYDIDVPDKYNSTLCPFMVLQPLVENCINYAIEPSGNESFVRIKASDDGKDVTLEVQDSGDGISPEKARAALNGTAERSGRASIGLHNVNQRLIYFYGESYGLEIESLNTPGAGTLVRMRFPLEFDPAAL